MADTTTGYISLYRSMTEWEWYHDIPTCRLYIHILLTCNWKSQKWRGQIIKPGELITSIRRLSEETGLSIQQVRTGLKNLVQTQEITQSSTQSYTRIKVIKWADFQQRSTGANTLNNKRINTLPTHSQHAGNTPVTHSQQQSNNFNNANKANNAKKTIKRPLTYIREDPSEEEIQAAHNHLVELGLISEEEE